jgi:4-aminobutyrate aminotransferase
VVSAVKVQLDSLPFCPRRYTHESAAFLARKLTELAPGLPRKVLLAPGGSEAISMALQIARAATGRHKTVSLWDSFHGATLDAISVGGEALFRRGIGPLLPGTEHAPPPDAWHCPWDCRGSCRLKCAEYIAYILEKEGDVAAVVAETVRSAPHVPPPGYWEIVRAACDRHGTLLILDEIYGGLGRTGRMFAFEHYGIEPDILVLGKALGGGVVPLAAVVARSDLDGTADRALGHYTHEKSPIGCAAALATIAVIEEEGLVDASRQMGAFLLERLATLRERHPLIGDVRGLGLLVGIELVRDRDTMERATAESEAVLYECLRRGLSFKVTQGNILCWTPPLVVERGELEEAVSILDEALGAVESRQGPGLGSGTA